VLSVFSKADLEVEMVTLQTMTVKLKLLGPINLHSLSNLVDSRLDLELFPALSLQKYKPVSVNVFASGSVMICGVKDLDIVSVIEHDLKLLL
jgi:TATA-box binding protein (TBP) (component of TFIID and TFIIIB)